MATTFCKKSESLVAMIHDDNCVVKFFLQFRHSQVFRKLYLSSFFCFSSL